MPQMEEGRSPASDGWDVVARLGLRRPVRREGAEQYLFLTLVSFAATVMATRVEFGLLVFLALADLASFYLRQFATVEVALLHGLLLFGVVAYRRHLHADATPISPS